MSAIFQRRHFNLLAGWESEEVQESLIKMLKTTNSRFNEQRFRKALEI
jgi:hypothetical protein